MKNNKNYRVLEMFFRGLKGEGISVKNLADEYEVSTKSVTRSINELKGFLLNNRDLVGNTELLYSYKDKCYHLCMDEFLSSKELFSLVEVVIGTRAFSKEELLQLTGKLKCFTTPNDKKKLEELIYKELDQYPPVKHDCESVQENLWQIAECIRERKEISIDYYKMDRSLVTRRVQPLSVMFTDYYFYMIAFDTNKGDDSPHYFRIDRIANVTVHRKRFDIKNFDEGLLRKHSLFMWPGKTRTIQFEFEGPSLQAVLDKLPTAKVIKRLDINRYLIEVKTYGDGIKMWPLSQGAWVKVVSPDDFVKEIKEEIIKMMNNY